MLVLAFVIGTAAVLGAQEGDALRFEKQRIGTATYEAASACDVNNDGVIDIVSGEYWFQGPDFAKEHKICDIQKVEDYYDDFSDYPLDVNGDGYVDIVSGGWWGETLVWRENPKGQDAEWQNHVVAKVGNIERTCFWDVDGDGQVEAVPNTPGGPQRIFKLVRDANGKGTGTFEEHVVYEAGSGHGLGFGDVNGDGRGDIILAGGWLEAPKDVYKEKWAWHPEFNFGGASVPILVHDVNADGKPDIIVGQGHDYGLAWHEQKADADGNRTWTKHDIDTGRSQYHDMLLEDIDNDGKVELITGKRYRAHQEHDPGSLDPVGVYYFKISDGEFKRYDISYGAPGEASGSGIYMWIADLDGNGWKDLVAPGKDGLYLFRNLGNK